MPYDYDLLVIGSGPAGQKAAIQAAKLRRSVTLVECGREVGGVCVNTGTIPSKTVREAIIYLTGLNQRAIYGQAYRAKEGITIEDLRARMFQVIERERSVIRDQLVRNHVRLVEGRARFLDPHVLGITDGAGSERRLSAGKIVIATGSRPMRPPDVAFNDRTILDSDAILQLERLPESVVVVGAGVIGIEYASMFAALGSKVTLIDARHAMLDFCDAEITEALRYHLRDLGVIFRFGEVVTRAESDGEGTLSHLASGKRIPAEMVFYSAGRQGAIDGLDLANAGLAADARGRIAVGPRYRTAVEHIYAAGDVIGFPSLAATAAEQGRIAACDAFGVEAHGMSPLLPIGIYAIPEISYVGRTEAELTGAGIPYEVGIARYRELARGHILGETHGTLKLLVALEDRKLLGVHIFGTGATELVHIGQAVMGLGGTIDSLVDMVFNYPTLAEAYKVAALDALNKLRAVNRPASPPPTIAAPGSLAPPQVSAAPGSGTQT
jgi:NAD(P) transhydrogenase